LTVEVEVLPSSCSTGVLCSLGPGAEAEAAVVEAEVAAAGVEAVAGVAAAEEAAEEEAAAVEAVVVDGASPFKKGTAITKGAENICSGVNPAMLTPRMSTSHFLLTHKMTRGQPWLTPWNGFDAGRV
jgi:hypothetical protein